MHRGAAVFVQDAERVRIAGCTFTQVGGNALMFSNHGVDNAVTDSEFVRSGDSAVVLLGSTNGVDASAPTHPDRTTVARNHMHEVGVYGKQTSCIAQQLSARSVVIDNVCHNGPRAGVNHNDGMFGGHHFEGNVLFNLVRETGESLHTSAMVLMSRALCLPNFSRTLTLPSHPLLQAITAL